MRAWGVPPRRCGDAVDGDAVDGAAVDGAAVDGAAVDDGDGPMVRMTDFAAELGELDACLSNAPDQSTRLRRMTDALLRAHPDLDADDAAHLVRWWSGGPADLRAAS